MAAYPPWSEAYNPVRPWPDTEVRRRGIATGAELGFALGSAYNFTKGFRSSNHQPLPPAPSWPSRFRSGFTLARSNCLRTAGAGAGLFAIGDLMETALVYYRKKEDPYNTFATWGAIAAAATAKHGPIVSSCSALGFGTLGAICHHLVDTREAQKIRTNDAPSSSN